MFLDPNLEKSLASIEKEFGLESLELIVIDLANMPLDKIEKISPKIGEICDKFLAWFLNFSDCAIYMLALDEESLEIANIPAFRVFFVVPTRRHDFFHEKTDAIREALGYILRKHCPTAKLPRVECTHIKKSAVITLEKEALRGGDPALVNPRFKSWLPKEYWGGQFPCRHLSMAMISTDLKCGDIVKQNGKQYRIVYVDHDLKYFELQPLRDDELIPETQTALAPEEIKAMIDPEDATEKWYEAAGQRLNKDEHPEIYKSIKAMGKSAMEGVDFPAESPKDPLVEMIEEWANEELLEDYPDYYSGDEE